VWGTGVHGALWNRDNSEIVEREARPRQVDSAYPWLLTFQDRQIWVGSIDLHPMWRVGRVVVEESEVEGRRAAEEG
jgi:hypothetical protein